MGLEDGGFGIGAEDFLEGHDDLALGGMNPCHLQEYRHQVDVRLRCLFLQDAKCLLDLPAVAVSRGLLLDLLATGDRASVDAAVERYRAQYAALTAGIKAV